jgi:hypothetical protein
VDRYNQKSKTVRVLTYYGLDNQIDGIVLDVLLRKHRNIRESLGVSVPVPADSGQVMKAIYEGLLLRGRADAPLLEGFEDLLASHRQDVHVEWERAAEREKRSRTVFAQETIRPDEVLPELEAAKDAVGGQADVRRFVVAAVERHGGAASAQGRAHRLFLTETPRALRDRLTLGDASQVDVVFDLPEPEKAAYLTRTHPLVEGLASYVADTALDPLLDGAARRCGAIRTRAVTTRTTLLLLRLRHHILSKRRGEDVPLLAEECRVVAFEGSPDSARWLDDAAAERLLMATPDANIGAEQAQDLVERVVRGLAGVTDRLDDEAASRARAVRDAHVRVRTAARLRGVAVEVRPVLPVDVLGVFVLVPAVV